MPVCGLELRRHLQEQPGLRSHRMYAQHPALPQEMKPKICPEMPTQDIGAPRASSEERPAPRTGLAPLPCWATGTKELSFPHSLHPVTPI